MGNKQLKIGVILSYTSTSIKTIMTLVYIPIILRLLGQSEYGLYQLVYSTVSYLSLLSFGLTSSYIRFYTREEKENGKKGIAKLNGLFMIVMLAISAVAIIAGIALTFNIDKIFQRSLTSNEIATARVLMSIAVLNVAISFPCNVFSCYLAAHERYAFQRGFLVVSSLLEPFMTIPILLLGFGSVGMISVIVILCAAQLVFYMLYCIRKLHMRFDFKNLQFGLLKEIYIFSFFIFLSDVTIQINWSVDKFLLGIFKGTVSVAVYSLASQINTMFCTFGTTIFSVFIPRVNRFVVQNDKHQELNELFIKVGRIQFEVIMLIFTGFVLLGKPFIKIWGGHGYEQSYYVALILLSAVIPSQIQNLGIQIQMAMNKHKFRSVCYFLIAIFNVIISIPLCIKYGPVGSATGTAIALVLGTWIVMNIYYHKKIKLNIFKFWKSILSIVTGILIAFAIGYAITKFYKPVSIFQIIVIGLTYVVVYAISLFLFSMNQYEKEIVYSIFKKFIIIVR